MQQHLRVCLRRLAKVGEGQRSFEGSERAWRWRRGPEDAARKVCTSGAPLRTVRAGEGTVGSEAEVYR